MLLLQLVAVEGEYMPDLPIKPKFNKKITKSTPAIHVPTEKKLEGSKEFNITTSGTTNNPRIITHVPLIQKSVPSETTAEVYITCLIGVLIL